MYIMIFCYLNYSMCIYYDFLNPKIIGKLHLNRRKIQIKTFKK